MFFYLRTSVSLVERLRVIFEGEDLASNVRMEYFNIKMFGYSFTQDKSIVMQ